MTIKVYLDFDYCTIAVQHQLSFGNKITSLKSFKGSIESYLIGYGNLAIDDHQNEYLNFEDEAKLIVKKYYK